MRFITNTTMRNRRQLQERFTRAGLPVPRDLPEATLNDVTEVPALLGLT